MGAIPGKRGCHGTNNRGAPCDAYTVPGGTVCHDHGGSAPQVAAKAAVRAELMAWRIGDALDDPGVTLLRLITQSRRRVVELGMAIERLVERHGGDLLEALVDDSWTVNDNGVGVKTGEYVRAIVQLEERERDRLGRFATLAINAKLGEKAIEAAKEQGSQIAYLLREVLTSPDLALTTEQRKAVPGVASRVLELVRGGS